MRRYLQLALILLWPSLALCQTTTVTGTNVSDVNGNQYASGTASAAIQLATGSPIANLVLTRQVPTNGSGSFSFSGSNALSTNSAYVFTICAMPIQIGPLGNSTPKQVCFSTGAITVSGASQDITAQCNAAAAVLGPQLLTGITLNGNNNWTGNQTHSGTETFSNPIVGSITGTATSATTATNLSGPGTITGNYTIGGNNSLTGNNTHSGAELFKLINNFVYVDQYATGGLGTAASPWTSPSGTGGFQEALAAIASSSVGGCLLVRTGFYNLTTTFNGTTNATSIPGMSTNGQPVHPICIWGQGITNSILIGNTGGIVLDFTGSGGMNLKNFAVQSGSVTPSTVGMLFARSNAGGLSGFTNQTATEGLYVSLATSPSSNGGYGSIALYCYNCETNKFYGQFLGDTGIIQASDNIASISSPYQTFSSVQSNTNNTYGALYGSVTATAKPAIVLEGQADNTIVEGVISSANSGSTNAAIQVLPPTSGSAIIRNLNIRSLQIEPQYNRVLDLQTQIDGGLLNASYNPAVGVSAVTIKSSTGGIAHATVDLIPANNAPAHPLFDQNGGAGLGVIGSTVYLHTNQSISLANSSCAGSSFLTDESAPTVTCVAGTGGFSVQSSSNFSIPQGPLRTVQAIADQGGPCTNGELALSTGWQSTGSATVTAVAGNGQTCSWTITTGTTTAANPTVTDTLTNTLPEATTVCELNIHGGTHTPAAGEGFTQTTLSATAPIFTFIGTPTANGFTYFVTRRCGP